ncbi:MAG: hypothetical protein LIP06_08520 [Tannerellaceae bacterium]|nr:hypothetical protein [Tannerellaceae bacterium]
MNKWILLGTLCIYVAWSCSSKGNREKENPAVVIEENKKTEIDLFQVESMQVIYTDDESILSYLTENDRVRIGDWVKDAQYDEQWNDSNVMLKMIAPDYTLIIRYRDLSPEEDDWLMIWKNTGKIKFRNLWYIVGEEKAEEISRLLESYR